MAGRELTRQSSFERMMNLVSTDGINNQQEVENNNSAYIIQQWYTRQSKFMQVKNNIKESISHVRMIKNSLVTIRASSGKFENMQRNLSTPSFVSALTAFLSILPLDPSLKAKNSLARNPRTIGSAFFIHFFPDEVLLDDEERDYSWEATESAKAAAMLVRSFDIFVNLCSTLITPSADIDNSVNCQLRQAMISYRFNIRYFIEKLDQWKELDASRLLDSLEQPYIGLHINLISGFDVFFCYETMTRYFYILSHYVYVRVLHNLPHSLSSLG
jgi:hypothetical protein